MKLDVEEYTKILRDCSDMGLRMEGYAVEELMEEDRYDEEEMDTRIMLIKQEKIKRALKK